jgi:hypothetical protein
MDPRQRKAQDDSWEWGYTCGQNGEPAEPPEGVSWPSHWRMGYRAALEDIERKKKPTTTAGSSLGKARDFLHTLDYTSSREGFVQCWRKRTVPKGKRTEESRLQAAQDLCWLKGYEAFLTGPTEPLAKAVDPPEDVSWPSCWMQGYRAAEKDQDARQTLGDTVCPGSQQLLTRTNTRKLAICPSCGKPFYARLVGFPAPVHTPGERLDKGPSQATIIGTMRRVSRFLKEAGYPLADTHFSDSRYWSDGFYFRQDKEAGQLRILYHNLKDKPMILAQKMKFREAIGFLRIKGYSFIKETDEEAIIQCHAVEKE